MAFELVYTSVPKGIRSGSSGFCIAAYTNGMAANLAVQLESLSAYKPFFPHYDPNASKNPVAYSHYCVSCSGNLYHVVSRVCFAGLDYTKRSNKLAHHLALAASDIAQALDGPTAVFRQDGLFLEKWDAPPQLFPKQKIIHAPHLQLHPANLWQQYAGDAGWAGTLVQNWLEKPERPVFIVFDPLIHTDILGLVEEALLLLPENRRWDVSFNTYFTSLPAGIKCSWRFCTVGSDVLREAHRTPGTLVIDLTKPLSAADNGEWQQAARTGQRPVQKAEVPEAKTFSSTATAPLKRHSKSADLRLKQSPAAAPRSVNPYTDSLTRQKNMVLHSSQKDKSKTILIGSMAAVVLVLVCGAVGMLCWISAKTGPTKPVAEIAVEKPDSHETVKPSENKEEKQKQEIAQQEAERKKAEEEKQKKLAEKQEAERKKVEAEKKRNAIDAARKSIAEEFCSRTWMLAPEKSFYDKQDQSVELGDILLGSEKVVALYIREDNKDKKIAVNGNFCEEQIQNKNPLLSQQSSFNYRFEVKYGQGKSDRKSITLVNKENGCTSYKIAALRIGFKGLSDRIVPLLYDFQLSDEDSAITVKPKPPVLFQQGNNDKFTVRLDKGKIVWEYTLRDGETKLPRRSFKLQCEENNPLNLYRRENVLTCNLPFDDFGTSDKIQKLKTTKANLQCRNQCKTFFKQKEADFLQAERERNNEPQSNKGSNKKDKKEEKARRESEKAPIFVFADLHKWCELHEKNLQDALAESGGYGKSMADMKCRERLKKANISAKNFSRDDIQRAYAACSAIQRAYKDYTAQKDEYKKQLNEGKCTREEAGKKYQELFDRLFDKIDAKHFPILWKIYTTNVARKKIELPELTEADKAILNDEINKAETARKKSMSESVEKYKRTTYEILDGDRSIKTLKGE